MAYSAEEKASAIAIVRRCGGQTDEAMRAIAAALGRTVSKSTVHDWLKTAADSEPKRTRSESAEPNVKKANRPEKQPVTEALIAQADEALDGVFEHVAQTYLHHALKPEVLADVKGKDAVMAAAIATDKMRLLRGLPTEIVQILPGLVQTLTDAGFNPAEVFLAMMNEAQHVISQRAGE
jgi:transposase-like protein